MQRLNLLFWCVLLVVLGPGCVSLPAEPSRPAGPVQTRQFTGDLAEAFGGVRTIAFADEFVSLSEVTGSVSETHPSQNASEAEHLALLAGLRASVRTAFEQAGYEWVEDQLPQRTIEVAVLLSTQDSLNDLERFYEISPGYLDPTLSARGAIALAVSWPGRADPVWRGMIEDLADYGSPLEDRLAVLPSAVETLLADLPKGPVEPRELEATESESDTDASDAANELFSEVPTATPQVNFDRATGRP